MIFIGLIWDLLKNKRGCVKRQLPGIFDFVKRDNSGRSRCLSDHSHSLFLICFCAIRISKLLPDFVLII